MVLSKPETNDTTSTPNDSQLEANSRQSTVNCSAEQQVSSWPAWSTVAGTFLIEFYVVGVLTAFGVFQNYYTTTFLTNYSASNISWLGGVQYFFQLGLAPVGGKIYDAGFGRLSILIGSFLFSTCLFLLSIVQPNKYYQVFLVQALGMGIGLMLVFVPAMTMVSQHFTTHRALAMGIVAASAPTGAVLYTILLNHLFYNSVGFVWGVRIVGFMSLGCFVIGNALIRTPPKPGPTSPEKIPFQELAAPFWDLPYVLTLISGFLWALGAQTPNFYMQLFASMHNVNDTLVSDSFAILSFASIFGRTIPGWMADRWGAVNVFIPSLVALGLVSFSMLGSTNPGGLVSFAIFYGFIFGTIISIYLPMIASVTVHNSHMGRRMGLALSPIGIGSTIGPPIAGLILGPKYAWTGAIVYSGVMILVAACFNTAARQIHLKRTNL